MKNCKEQICERICVAVRVKVYEHAFEVVSGRVYLQVREQVLMMIREQVMLNGKS